MRHGVGSATSRSWCLFLIRVGGGAGRCPPPKRGAGCQGVKAAREVCVIRLPVVPPKVPLARAHQRRAATKMRRAHAILACLSDARMRNRVSPRHFTCLTPLSGSGRVGPARLRIRYVSFRAPGLRIVRTLRPLH